MAEVFNSALSKEVSDDDQEAGVFFGRIRKRTTDGLVQTTDAFADFAHRLTRAAQRVLADVTAAGRGYPPIAGSRGDWDIRFSKSCGLCRAILREDPVSRVAV